MRTVKHTGMIYLHSIMYLLILDNGVEFSDAEGHLHSIMYLLIHRETGMRDR